MKLITLIINLLLFFSLFGQTEQDEVFITIGRKNISKEEFIHVYKKNNAKPLPTNKDSLNAQLNRFINFKLKVIEAENRDFNKSDHFLKEFSAYKKQLAEPFLVNKETFERLLIEAYKRIKYEVRASHILVKVNEYASPEDTLIAYNKAMSIKTRLLESENFENVARETSDDPSAVINGGDLWYVRAFQTPYKFENYLFKGIKNKLSPPIRTKYGYHIIKIVARRLNPGKYKVAHIMISVAKNINKQEENKAKNKIDNIYQQVLQGEDFDQMVMKYSDDKGTAANKGELPWFGTGKMSHEFEMAAFNLKKKGDISKPVRTKYGWHIIKKIDQQKISEFNQMKDQIKNMVSNSDRHAICKQNLIERFQKENNFSENKELSIFYTAVDSSIFEKKWKLPDLIDLEDVLFIIGENKYTKYDFAKSLEQNQKNMFPIPINNYVNQQYEEFRNNKIIEFELNSLSRENKSYKYLVDEFHDGMLLFEIMEKEIWEKAKNDTVGLKRFYENNIKKYNKFFTADISIFNFENGTDIRKLKKYFVKYKKQALSDDMLAKRVSKSVKKEFKFKNSFKAEEDLNDIFKLVVAKYRSGSLRTDQKLIILEKHNTLVYLNTAIMKTKKTCQNYKSDVISDYQNYLDGEWLKNLRSKYKITINENVLNSML
ncbi:MAG: peptidylprolyl isomerase [Bacteroidota bacterium]